MTGRPCVTHHHACDCREEYFAAMAERTKNRAVEIANSERAIRELGAQVAEHAGMAKAHLDLNLEMAALVTVLCDAVHALLADNQCDFNVTRNLEYAVRAAMDDLGQSRPAATP